MKVVVVMPAYNASRTLARTINDIPFSYVDELILVDDASWDSTYERAVEIGNTHPALTFSPEAGKTLFTIVGLPENRGYGGNQKQCYDLALAHGADIVVMLHPDYQYDARLITELVEGIRSGRADVMLGSRIRSYKEAREGGMPTYKYYANKFLSALQNTATGLNLSEWHTGMRAYTKEVLTSIAYKKFSNDFVFDSQVLLAIAERGYRIADVPVSVRYHPEASSIGFVDSVLYGVLTLAETYALVMRKFPRSYLL